MPFLQGTMRMSMHMHFADTSRGPRRLGPPTSTQTGSQYDQEGWKNNSVYITFDDVDDKSETDGNTGEGWADNSIYQ